MYISGHAKVYLVILAVRDKVLYRPIVQIVIICLYIINITQT